MTYRETLDFSSRKSRRRFSQTFFILGVFLILGWQFCQEKTWKALFMFTDPNRNPPEWMDKMEDISRTERLLPEIPAELLENIQDGAPVYANETRSLMKIWNRVNAMTPEEIRDASIGRVLFAQYSKQPGTYRGNVVRIRGNIRLIEKQSIHPGNRKNPEQLQVPDPTKDPEQKNTAAAQLPQTEESSGRNDPEFGYDFDHYYELWIQPDDAPAEPVLVNALEIPEHFPLSQEIRIPVVIDGVFFKLYLYEQSDGILGTTPAFYAKKPLWFYAPLPDGQTPQDSDLSETETEADKKTSVIREIILGIGFALLLAGIFFKFVEYRTRPPKPQEPLPDTIEIP